ncbi:ATP-binding cassette domain-containing protein [Robertkochia solimangrovi]|uniref:ATP-binding cassette domain-containing protein n=1 Tax=Robertkochia solimangrovi TaxID=2213046 RepID=UPI0011816DE5|nr:ATP-binding cassette domain-containing protein [Robertkochia solimangrovi]
MYPNEHRVIMTGIHSGKKRFIEEFHRGRLPETLAYLTDKKGAFFSNQDLDKFIDEEELHDRKILTDDPKTPLKNMSGGEQRRALLNYLLSQKPDYLVLDNPFDHLDKLAVKDFKERLHQVSSEVILIMLLNRTGDIPAFISVKLYLQQGIPRTDPADEQHLTFDSSEGIPAPVHPIKNEEETLVDFRNIHVSYGDRTILDNINWTIKKGEFWHLMGGNGTGKTTLMNMVTGDNPKGFGQELYIFGKRKGSGESVWDLKRSIGIFTPKLTQRFKGRPTISQMITGGFHDSVGLYQVPSELEKEVTRKWVKLLGMEKKADSCFQDLGEVEQRLIMIARAMVKHPPLLILDEPTTDLDDQAAALVVKLVNEFARHSTSAVVYISHRDEEGLLPQLSLELMPSESGSQGKITEHKNIRT